MLNYGREISLLWVTSTEESSPSFFTYTDLDGNLIFIEYKIDSDGVMDLTGED